MADTIGQRELRNDNARIIDAVVAGRTFIVTRHGTPVAEIGPVQEGRRPRFVRRAALLEAAAQGPHLDAAGFRADVDAVLDQSL